MPELPEVEVTRLGFADRIAGARIEAVRLGKPLRWPLGVEPAALVGPHRARRCAGAANTCWSTWTRACCCCTWACRAACASTPRCRAAGAHDHFDLVTSRGTLRLNDPRRFGAVVYAEDEAAPLARQAAGRPGRGAAGRRLRPRRLPCRPAAAPGADQAGAAGRRRGGGRGQHLCVGGAVPGRHPADAVGVAHQPAARRAPACGGARRAGARGANAAAARCATSPTSTGRAATSSSRPWSTAARASRAGSAATPIRQMRQGQRSTYFCPNCQKY